MISLAHFRHRPIRVASSQSRHNPRAGRAKNGWFPIFRTHWSTTKHLPGTGAPIALPVFGRINKTNTSAMPAGSYVDVLQVTISW